MNECAPSPKAGKNYATKAAVCVPSPQRPQTKLCLLPEILHGLKIHTATHDEKKNMKENTNTGKN